MAANNSDEEGDKLVAAPDFRGPVEHRHCTDILFLILLFAMWTAMTGIGIHAVTNGDYRLVVYPLDYDGNICGTDFAEDMVRIYIYQWNRIEYPRDKVSIRLRTAPRRRLYCIPTKRRTSYLIASYYPLSSYCNYEHRQTIRICTTSTRTLVAFA